MSYRLRSSGEVKSKSQLIALNPNMSLPSVWTPATHEALNVDPIVATSAPEPSSEDKVVVKNGIEQNQDGGWVTSWVEQDKYASPEEKTAALARDAENLAQSMRERRDVLLARTDWMGLSDVTMSAEMSAYRQALRDVPQQAGFPNTITWPTKPEA